MGAWWDIPSDGGNRCFCFPKDGFFFSMDGVGNQ
jgi:hypothetical protein